MYRKATGALGALLIAVAGAVALASPVSAGGKHPAVSFEDTCTDTAIVIENPTRHRVLVKIASETLTPEPVWVGKRDTHTVEWPAEHGENAEVSYKTWRGWRGLGEHSWVNRGWPGGGDSCTGPEVMVVEHCDGSVIATVSAGDTRRSWRVGDREQFLDFGDVVEFQVESVDVEILWVHRGEWKQAEEEYTSRFPAEDCPSPSPSVEPSTTPEPTPTPSASLQPTPSDAPPILPASGGEQLPRTGSPVAVLGAAGVGLLALGGVGVVLGRRRTASNHR